MHTAAGSARIADYSKGTSIDYEDSSSAIADRAESCILSLPAICCELFKFKAAYTD
jgi:hypothetical protein